MELAEITITMFSDIEIEKWKFECYKNPIFWKDIDIDNILICNKISSDEKNFNYFIGYRDDDYKIKALLVILPNTGAHIKADDGKAKSTYFLIEGDKLLKRYKNITNKVSNSIRKEFDRKPIYNKKKNLKTKTKSRGDEATDFYG